MIVGGSSNLPLVDQQRSRTLVPTRSHARGCAPGRASRQAFTLIELIIVVSVIMALMAMMLPAVSSYRERAAARQTQALISSLVGAMNSHGTDTIRDPLTGTIYRLWYVAGEGYLDGDPTAEEPPYSAALLEAMGRGDSTRESDQVMRYNGPARMLAVAIPDRHIDSTTGRIVDAWGRPLRVLDPSLDDDPYEAEVLRGVVGIGLWSAGPSGDPQHLDDNIVSWGSGGLD